MGNQAGFDPNVFGPFGALFQGYFDVWERFGQAQLPLAGGSTAANLDPQTISSQLTAPLKAAARCQLETLGLMTRRTQAYLQVPTRLAQCRTPQDLVNEQMAFWRTAGEQYRESAARIGEAWGQAFPWLGAVRAGVAERDYISFNGTGSRESGNAHAPRPEAGKQRRVA